MKLKAESLYTKPASRIDGHNATFATFFSSVELIASLEAIHWGLAHRSSTSSLSKKSSMKLPDHP